MTIEHGETREGTERKMIMNDFVYEPNPARVIFGSATREQVGQEVERLGGKRAIVLATPGRGQQVAANIAMHLGSRSIGICADARMHTPVDVTERLLTVVEKANADILVAVGGGSSIGLSKALAIRTGLPQIVLPTTYAGSEMTPVLGETANGRKTTRRSPEIQPETVIYDVELTVSLPEKTSVISGMNAIAHAMEALYAVDGNPLLSIMAEEGIAKMAHALPRIAADPADMEARTNALYGAFLCGSVLGSTSMALHHKLAHILGGMLDLPHAQTHATLLPHTAAYNAPATKVAMDRMARALDTANVPNALFDLASSHAHLPNLRDLGMLEKDITPVVEQVLANPFWNPRPLEAGSLEQLIWQAWKGERPQAQ